MYIFFLSPVKTIIKSSFGLTIQFSVVLWYFHLNKKKLATNPMTHRTLCAVFST